MIHTVQLHPGADRRVVPHCGFRFSWILHKSPGTWRTVAHGNCSGGT